jgi:hypothetical protein
MEKYITAITSIFFLIILWNFIPSKEQLPSQQIDSPSQTRQSTQTEHTEAVLQNQPTSQSTSLIFEEIPNSDSQLQCPQTPLEDLVHKLFAQSPSEEFSFQLNCLTSYLMHKNSTNLNESSLFRLVLLQYKQSEFAGVVEALSDQQIADFLLKFVHHKQTEAFIGKHWDTHADVLLNFISQVAKQHPDKLLFVLENSKDHSLNEILLMSIMDSEVLVDIEDFWPAVANGYWGSGLSGNSKDQVLEDLIWHYLTIDAESTITWLHDQFALHPTGQHTRKFNFPKAVKTMYAWQSGELAKLSAEEYEKDSLLVIEYMGSLLTQDPQHLTNQFNQIADTPLVEPVVASLIQSEQFFMLSHDQLLDMLNSSPANVASALAQAYTLQLQYSEATNKDDTLQLLQQFITPK